MQSRMLAQLKLWENHHAFHPIFVISVCAAPDAANTAPPGLRMVGFDYEANVQDELGSDLMEMLSTDSLTSRDEGWRKKRHALHPILKLSITKIL